MNSGRRVALAALSNWRTGRKFADSTISELLANSELPTPERAFALELFYGVLRNLTLLDFWIGQLRQGRLENSLRDLLRIGIYQIFLLQTPPHAAVNESVELAPKNQRAVVNAILRNAIRQSEGLQGSANTQPPAVQWSHPEFLLERWQKHFGNDATIELCAWNNRPPPVYARINHLKIASADFIRTYPGSFFLPNRENFAGMPTAISEAVAAGHCYIQDPSTAAACELLDPQPGEKILDACAAPGGKTGYLAELMQNRGILVACDQDPDRIKRLGENLSRLGASITRFIRHDWDESVSNTAIKDYAPFDRILVDAPCSNTGVMRRRVDVRWRLRPDDFARMQQRQLAIVNAVLPLLKPGGVFVYSTCSLEPEENELVAEVIATERRLDNRQRILPFREGFDGAFVARFLNDR